MYHIVYLSTAVGAVEEQELKEILVKSRAKNTRLRVTGMLLLSGEKWMQVLEGDQEEVTALYHTIARDPRHTGITKLSDGEISQRGFPDWSMGFTTASPEEFERLSGYFNPSHSNFLPTRPAPADSAVFDLLREFSVEKETLR